jgi:hypothetical protein
MIIGFASLAQKHDGSRGGLIKTKSRTQRPPSSGLFVFHRSGQWTSFPQVEFNAQSVCDFFNAPLITNGIAGRRNHRRLPPESMVFANTNVNLADAQRSDDHVG